MVHYYLQFSASTGSLEPIPCGYGIPTVIIRRHRRVKLQVAHQQLTSNCIFPCLWWDTMCLVQDLPSVDTEVPSSWRSFLVFPWHTSLKSVPLFSIFRQLKGPPWGGGREVQFHDSRCMLLSLDSALKKVGPYRNTSVTITTLGGNSNNKNLSI